VPNVLTAALPAASTYHVVNKHIGNNQTQLSKKKISPSKFKQAKELKLVIASAATCKIHFQMLSLANSFVLQAIALTQIEKQIINILYRHRYRYRIRTVQNHRIKNRRWNF
jgi:hypothetical protein